LQKAVRAEGLEIAAIENFDPGLWYDILLDGPRRQEQLDGLKTIIRRVGHAGIPVVGYYFSIAGVWGHVTGPWARGGAESVAYLGKEGPEDTPIPNGQVWNMVYDPDAPEGTIGEVTEEQIWARLSGFLKELVPVAEEAGVRLAAHPDDPPMPVLRNTARLVYRPELYQKLLDVVPSRSNSLELCMGTIAEMKDGEFDLYEALDRYSRQGKIAYVHFRKVNGKVPKYREVFVDEGETDMIKALRILRDNNFDGVLIPDHTPQMNCAAPWHAGMAFALGYMKAALSMVETEGISSAIT